MEKILVTTDFSENSKAGLRFAIQLNTQTPLELTFFHSIYLSPPSPKLNTDFEKFEKSEIENTYLKLKEFTEGVYKSMKLKPGKVNYVVRSAVFADSNIMDYAASKKFNYICISTLGAGRIKKFFGTNTSHLITQSSVPVIAVPSSYERSPVKKMLYASDLSDLNYELKKVVAFADPLKASVELLHINTLTKAMENPKIIENAVKKYSEYDISFSIKQSNIVKSLISSIESAIEKKKPSMLIMFTQQNRTLYDKIFLSSKAAEYSFNAKVPLLVFKKTKK
ncbi:MAG: universal stress protein [Bacteroidetes bacterium]|nr:MAG: universal stress protein [Bacteroidota bacterium]REJ99984.1 MAG: universal stress protein [Bacteroidota bacterium]REK35836.1 MAG: universal stress protein [Bacteroidota bacterium]REK49293.1 MAG: universal stress protein [Bacteroidota bacterium]